MPKASPSRIEYLRFMLEQLSQTAANALKLQVTAYILGMAAIEAAELEKKISDEPECSTEQRRGWMMRSVRNSTGSPQYPPNRWDTICFLQEMLEVLRRIAVAERSEMLVLLIDQAILDVRESVSGTRSGEGKIGQVIDRAPKLIGSNQA